MENSKNDIVAQNDSVAQKSFNSPPKRRRSTFFEKRDSIVPQQATENIDPNGCKQLTEVDEKHYQDLKRYHDKLLAEKNEWKAEVNRRRNKYRELKQQFQSATDPSNKSRIPYSLLSNEDIDFLQRKINISQFIDRQADFHKSVMQTKELYSRAVELDNVILDHCEKKLNKVTDYILQNSTIDFQE